MERNRDKATEPYVVYQGHRNIQPNFVVIKTVPVSRQCEGRIQCKEERSAEERIGAHTGGSVCSNPDGARSKARQGIVDSAKRAIIDGSLRYREGMTMKPPGGSPVSTDGLVSEVGEGYATRPRSESGRGSATTSSSLGDNGGGGRRKLKCTHCGRF